MSADSGPAGPALPQSQQGTGARAAGVARQVIFLAAIPPADRISALMADSDLRQTCRVIGSHVYIDYVRGHHNTGRTAPYFTRALGIDGTERNGRTVLALSVLCAKGRPSVR